MSRDLRIPLLAGAFTKWFLNSTFYPHPFLSAKYLTVKLIAAKLIPFNVHRNFYRKESPEAMQFCDFFSPKMLPTREKCALQIVPQH